MRPEREVAELQHPIRRRQDHRLGNRNGVRVNGVRQSGHPLRPNYNEGDGANEEHREPRRSHLRRNKPESSIVDRKVLRVVAPVRQVA